MPPCTANASKPTASLPAVYHLLLGNYEAPPVPPDTTLSHPIPLTYYVNEDYDDNLRQTRVVQVEDGYWIVYVRYATSNINRRLFILKTNREGRTMIPPFQLGTVTGSDDPDDYYSYRFALIPLAGGASRCWRRNGTASLQPSPPACTIMFWTGGGKIIRSEPIMTERTSYSQDFHSLWAARTKDGRTIFAALSAGAIWCGIYTDSSDARAWEAVPKPGTGTWDYFAASYDPALDRLFLMYSDYYKTSNGTFLSRWTPDGIREILVDYTAQLESVYDAYSYQLLPTPAGLLVSLPNYVNPYRFFLMNPDCTIKKQVAVSGLVVKTPSQGHMVTLDNSNYVRVAWRGTGSYSILYYAAFNLDGKLLVPAMRINQSGSGLAMHPECFR